MVERRVSRAVRKGQVRAIIVGALGLALTMFVFEAVKTAVWPSTTLWESHAITILFSTVFGTIAVAAALHRQSTLQARLLSESSERLRLAELSERLAEHALQLETAGARLAEETEARRRLERELFQSQKMESIGRIAGGLAHDFNNVLSVVLSSLDLAASPRAKPTEVTEDLGAAREAAEQAVRLTRQLLAFARHQPIEMETLDLDDLIERSAPVLQRLAGEANRIVLKLDARDATIRGVPSQIEQVIFNLIANAADAMPDGGRVTVSTRLLLLGAGEHGVLTTGGEFVEVSVRDTGVGIAPQALARIFEPFYTTKRNGTGFGLATTYAIVARAGGHVEATNNLDVGATFRVLLPRAEGSAKTAEFPVSAPIARLSGRVLLVEDQDAVREAARRLLVSAGFEVSTAANGRLALDLAQAWATPPDLLITDVVMPDLGGRQVATELRSRWPTLPVLFVSGYTDQEVMNPGDVHARFLQKPFTRDSLLASVGELLAAAPR